MPSLADNLSSLAEQSAQIQSLSAANLIPAGPYVQTYLYSSRYTSVLNLIRDASDSEVRLFKFIGETDQSEKRVEKREGLVTPLKELKSGRARGGREEVEVVLRTAAKLVDD